MFELNLYVARTYAMAASFLCIHELFLDNTNLDVDAIKQAMRLAKVDDLVAYKKDIIAKIPGSLAKLDSITKVDIHAQMESSKASLNTIVILALVYLHSKDMMDQIDLCLRTWAHYATLHESFTEPCKHFTKIFGTIQKEVLSLFKIVETLTLGIHTSVQKNNPDMVDALYKGAAMNQAMIVSEYTKQVMALI